jgi:DNA-binding XRE family transcriptional regulator
MTDEPLIGPRLKALRNRTGLSAAEVAKAIGRATTSYQHYEDNYKKPFLPVELTHQLIPVFQAAGVEAHELLSLAGIKEGDGSGPPVAIEATQPPPTLITPDQLWRVSYALEDLLEERRKLGGTLTPKVKSDLLVAACVMFRDREDKALIEALDGLLRLAMRG